MQITVPVTASGAANYTTFQGSFYGIKSAQLSFNVPEAYPSAMTTLDYQYDHGINVSSSTIDAGSGTNQLGWNTMWYLLGLLPDGFGVAASTVGYFYNNYLPAGLASSPNTQVPGAVNYTGADFGIMGGTQTGSAYLETSGYNIYGVTTIYQLTIAQRDFGNASQLTIGAENNGVSLDTGNPYAGAYSSVQVNLTPANTIYGTVTSQGYPAGNEAIVITQLDSSGSAVAQYYEETNASGYYRFFAQPGDTYEVQAVIPGGLSTGVQETLADNEDSTPINLAITAPAQATFTESGLTSGASWSVTMNGTTVSGTSGTLTVPNLQYGDTYSYSISAQGFTANPSSGSITVNDLTMSENVEFSPSDSITFAESGLASGTEWYLELTAPNGSHSETFTSGTSFTLHNVPYGTYDWTYSIPSGYDVLYQSGTVSISPTSNTASETGEYYAVGDITFSESTLPSGTTWSVSLNGQTVSSSGSSLTFTNLALGGYAYAVNVPFFYSASPQSGNAQTNSKSAYIITFTHESGTTVTFSEAGYPIAPGDEWSVTYGGHTQYSTSSSTTFTMPVDQTYSFSVPEVASSTYYYKASPSSGSWSTGDSPSTVQIRFSEVGLVRCVNATTEILMANGTYMHADQVTAGDQIMTFNTTTGLMQSEVVQHVYTTTETSQYTINGYLKIAGDQQVLTQNGYVSANNLTALDWMYNVYTHSWEKVHSVSSSTGTYTMYDFQVSGNSDFIAYSSVMESTMP